ncbi:MAG: hypothetical protein JOY58_02550 [Solirubrobacterales bacterium]|nr:hypothetical protein [Solirubrobacterales bacterium]
MPPGRSRWLVALRTVLVLAAALAMFAIFSDIGGTTEPWTIVTVNSNAPGQAVPGGFLGLSLEYQALEAYAGDDPDAVDPLFVKLVRSLAPAQSPVIRIGGDSTDQTWWPVPGLARPPGIRYTLTPQWIGVAKALAAAADAKLVLGVNLEAGDQRLASIEAQALVGGIRPPLIAALELGNEPELYASAPWYRAADGTLVHGRPPTYQPATFDSEFARFGSALPGTLPLAGPAIGGRVWLQQVPTFIASEPRLSLVTIHRYPLERCGLPASSPLGPSIANLLARSSSQGLAAGVAGYVAAAHARGLPLRVDELNSVACGGQPGVSDTFASALWVLDTLFRLLRVGVDGVNIHTFPNADYQPFALAQTGNGWRAFAEPEYYGLLLFARATPVGSTLLRVSERAAAAVGSYATRSRDGRLRVVLINTATSGSRMVQVRAAGAAGKATLQRLRAPNLAATSRVTLAGQSLGQSSGQLIGRQRTQSVKRTSGGYAVSMPAASAALLTLPRP